MNRIVQLFIVMLSLVLPVSAGFIFTETWDSSDAGWTSSGTGLSVSHSGTFGSPLGSLLGSFGAQGIPSPESGSFYADSTASGSAYTGNYWSDLGNFYGWSLDFYAEDILPSSLFMRFGDGVNTYQANLLSQVSAVGNWYTLLTPGLTFGPSGWLGAGGLGGLSNALASVQWLELRLDRNQESGQTYYVDNFLHRSDDNGGGDDGGGDDGGGDDGGGNVPEPGTLTMGLGLAGLSLSAWCRRWLAERRNRRRKSDPLSSSG